MSDRDNREERDEERGNGDSHERERFPPRDRDADRDGDDRGGENNRDERDEGGERKTVKRGSGELCPQSLLVRNISYRVTSGEIRSMMEKHGEVRDVYIPLDHHTGRSRGFAFVEFFDARDAR
jgi:RNA recognition motif-containing protein